jgi:tRNA (cmo5U34)-methyltransferase
MNTPQLGGFDAIAPIYDTLATMVFGRSIRNSQLFYLNEIPKGGRVLILGGGTGWLLADILRSNPGCEIWYVEASSRMIDITRSSIDKIPQARVHFIHGTQAQLPLHLMVDVVIANFYFDLFSMSSLEPLLKQLHSIILPNGRLLVADFVKNNLWWQSALLSAMYVFFRGICKIEASNLPDWQRLLVNYKFEHKCSSGFYGNFIRSVVYEVGEGQCNQV